MATNNATNTSNPITVAQGGTGDSSLTAYAVLCGGTTSTGNVQSIASVGTSGQILTSNGAGALPTFQAAGSVGSSLVLIQSQTASNSTTLDFTTNTNLYSTYMIVVTGVQGVTNNVNMNMQISNNGGSSWITTGYQSGLNTWAYTSATAANANQTTAFYCGVAIKNDSANHTNNGVFYIMNCNVGANAWFHGTGSYFDNGGGVSEFYLCGGQAGSTGTNAFRFLMSSGNISVGTITLYGLKTS